MGKFLIDRRRAISCSKYSTRGAYLLKFIDKLKTLSIVA